MRLAIFTSGSYPFQTHGAEIGIFYLARELTFGGNEVTLYLSEPTPTDKPIERIDLPKGMKIINSRGVPLRLVYNLSFITGAMAVLIKESDRPTLALVNVPTLLSLITVFFARQILGIPYLVIIHGPPDLDSPHGIVNRLQCFFISKASGIVCVSRDLVKVVHAKCQIDRTMLRVIPNGYDEQEVQHALAFTPLGADRLEIAFVGSLDKNKDPLALIKAFKLVANSIPDVFLRIIGSGPLEASCHETVTKDQLQDRVIFHGPMDHPELLQCLARCSFLVLTSHREGMPTVVIESLALGKPVVATGVGGLPEIIRSGENGFLVPVGNVEALADCIVRILRDNQLRKKLSLGARESVREYNWHHVTELYSELAHSFDRPRLG
jgi:glycosyltransferase involved in cell wall biosynthesis